MQKKLIKRLLLSTLLQVTTTTLVLGGVQEKQLSQAILENARKYNLDPKILYTLVRIESNFEPYAIAVETSRESANMLKGLRSDHIRVQVGKTYHSNLYLVSLFPDNKEDAKQIVILLKKLHFIFDVGLMQINTVNFNHKETAKMFDMNYNVKKGAKIFYSCTKLFKSFKHQVECYNRGAGNLRKSLRKGKSYAPYYNRFVNNWEF